MDDRYGQAGRGLRLLVAAELFLLLSDFVFAFRIPCLFVGFVLTLVGLNQAAQAHRGFQRAMSLLVVQIAVKLAAEFASRGTAGELLLTLAAGVLSLAVLYLVCTAAAELVEERGDSDLARRGRFVWKLNLLCTLLTLAGTVLTALPLAALLLSVAYIGVAVASLVGGALYLIFLYTASRYLRA